MLKRFETAIVSNDKEAISKLGKEASSKLTLNSRQRDAIMSRCSGYLSGISYSTSDFKTYNINS